LTRTLQIVRLQIVGGYEFYPSTKLEATKYEIKSKIIEMVAANPFEGMVTENPYRHIRHFTTLCNTVRQEGVPDEWFKWNLFPYLLAGEAKTWYSFASFEVEGNWNKLTKKFCEKLFPISKVLTVKIRQPSHEFTFGVGMTFVSYSLVLTPVV
jgi:hypothetical protein